MLKCTSRVLKLYPSNLLPKVMFIPRPIYLLGATSIVGYNIILRQRDGLIGVVTSRLSHHSIATWPRLALHDFEELAGFCSGLAANTIIIYCDAVCDVSKCQQNPSWAREINIGNLQRTLRLLPDTARLVYVSSDHVFGEDGRYDENSKPCPVSIYGEIRAEAEQLALSREGTMLVRAGLPIGPSLDGKSGHLDWLRYRLGKGLPVTIIKDESRTAMPSPLLADRIVDLALSDITGIRHVSATRLVSRGELARALKEHFGFKGELDYGLRIEQPAPHLGRIHITTRFNDELARPLPCPVDLLSTDSELLTTNNPPAYSLEDDHTNVNGYAELA